MSFWSLIGLPDKRIVSGLQEEIRLLRDENKLLQEKNRDLLEKIIDERHKNVIDMFTKGQESSEAYIHELNSSINELFEKVTGSISNVLMKISEINGLLNSLSNENMSLIKTLNNETKETTDKILAKVHEHCVDTNRECDVIKDKINEAVSLNSKNGCEYKNEMMENITNQFSDVIELVNSMQGYIIEENRKIAVCEDITTENGNYLKKLIANSEQIQNKTKELSSIREDVSILSESVQNLWTIMKAIWVDSVLSDLDNSI